MESILYNGNIIPSATQHELLKNRGFLYGDGFFETLIIRDKKIFFLPQHVHRALQAAKVLQLRDFQLTEEQLIEKLNTLWRHNQAPATAIVKWLVWRNSEGLYAPTGAEAIQDLMQLKPYREAPERKNKAVVAKTVFNHYSVYSGFKRLSALPYVLAGLEKKQSDADEIILLDQNGNLSECGSSALCWIRNDQLYTPATATGCVYGVTQNALKAWLTTKGIVLNEVCEPLSILEPSCTVFSANVTGLSLIGQIGETVFQNDHPWYGNLQQALATEPFFFQNLETAD